MQSLSSGWAHFDSAALCLLHPHGGQDGRGKGQAGDDVTGHVATSREA